MVREIRGVFARGKLAGKARKKNSGAVLMVVEYSIFDKSIGYTGTLLLKPYK